MREIRKPHQPNTRPFFLAFDMRDIKPLRLTKVQIEIQKLIPRSTVASLGFELSCSIVSSVLAGQTGMSDHRKLIAFPLFVFYLSANDSSRKKAFLSSNTLLLPSCFSSLAPLYIASSSVAKIHHWWG